MPMIIGGGGLEQALNLTRVELPIELQKTFKGLCKTPLFYIGYCKKLSSDGKVQRRVLVCTLDHFYACHPNGDILRCFPFSMAERIIHDPIRQQLAIIVPEEYDVAFEVPNSYHFIDVFDTLRAIRPETPAPLTVQYVLRQRKDPRRDGLPSALLGYPPSYGLGLGGGAGEGGGGDGGEEYYPHLSELGGGEACDDDASDSWDSCGDYDDDGNERAMVDLGAPTITGDDAMNETEMKTFRPHRERGLTRGGDDGMFESESDFEEAFFTSRKPTNSMAADGRARRAGGSHSGSFGGGQSGSRSSSHQQQTQQQQSAQSAAAFAAKGGMGGVAVARHTTTCTSAASGVGGDGSTTTARFTFTARSGDLPTPPASPTDDGGSPKAEHHEAQGQRQRPHEEGGTSIASSSSSRQQQHHRDDHTRGTNDSLWSVPDNASMTAKMLEGGHGGPTMVGGRAAGGAPASEEGRKSSHFRSGAGAAAGGGGGGRRGEGGERAGGTTTRNSSGRLRRAASSSRRRGASSTSSPALRHPNDGPDDGRMVEALTPEAAEGIVKRLSYCEQAADWWYFFKQAAPMHLPFVTLSPEGVIQNWNDRFYKGSEADVHDPRTAHRRQRAYKQAYERKLLFRWLFWHERRNRERMSIHNPLVPSWEESLINVQSIIDNDPFVYGENVAGHPDEVCIGKPPYTVRLDKPVGWRLCLYTGKADGDEEEYEMPADNE